MSSAEIYSFGAVPWPVAATCSFMYMCYTYVHMLASGIPPHVFIMRDTCTTISKYPQDSSGYSPMHYIWGLLLLGHSVS